ncbi:MAG TPA: hypothetical protein VFT76_01990 [Actinomycetota bacterium]|nr:hypothetical protein [Actinomycetota bacterium]
MAWTIDLLSNAGSTILADAPWRTAKATWSLDGPGSLEVDLIEDDAPSWVPNERRVVLRRDGTAKWAGWLSRLRTEGRPKDFRLTASALGLSSILGSGVVHGDFSRTGVVATTIAWDLIAHLQAQANAAFGFTLGAVVGTATSRTRNYCDGDNIAEAIDELAGHDPGGFDWDLSPTGAFRAWVGGRGSVTGITVSRNDAQEWSVESEGVDVATYATVIGDADEPCGAPLVTVSSSLAGTYPRREAVVDADSTDSAEMTTKGTEELRKRTAARIRSTAGYVGASQIPFATWESVWLGDRVTIAHPAWHGGSQTMRCTQVEVSLERGTLRQLGTTEDFSVYEYTFEGV